MNNLLRKLGKEWEKTLFTVVLLLILGYLGALAYKLLNDDDGSSNDNVKPKNPHEYFDTHSFAYLKPANLDKEVNPLLFHVHINLPPPPTPKQDPGKPAPKPDPKKPEPKTPTPQPGGAKPTPPAPPQNTTPKPTDNKNTTPNNTQTTKPATPPKPTTPPPPPRKISIQYRGFIKGDDAQVAFYSANDSKTKKTEAKTAKPGAKIHGVLEIKSFDASKIVLSLNGKDVVVSKGKKQEIVVQ